jgi:antitoxin component YwqK of YwqJK toxin-antitoxin module
MTEENNYSGVDRTYYDPEKTQLKSEVFIHMEKREGIYKEYYKNEQLCKKVNYINGKENGIYKSYFKNGQVKEEVNYINGKKMGYINHIMIIGKYFKK